MPHLFELSEAIKRKIDNPENTLRNIPLSSNPLIIHPKDIISVDRIAKYLYKISCPVPIYVSTAFNKDFSFSNTKYNEIRIKRVYDSIYFDIEVV